MQFISQAVLAGCAALSLAACASTKEPVAAEAVAQAGALAEPFDPFTLEIEAGRWGAMNAQMAEIVGAPPALVDQPEDESDIARRARLSEHLRLQVTNLAQVKARACPDGRLGKAACGAEFKPDWAGRKETPPPSWAVLQTRSDAVGDVVMPAWDEICAGEKERAGPQLEEEMICPME